MRPPNGVLLYQELYHAAAFFCCLCKLSVSGSAAAAYVQRQRRHGDREYHTQNTKRLEFFRTVLGRMMADSRKHALLKYLCTKPFRLTFLDR
ncbi:uncharacterized protein BDZ99DRAFT_182662 [Mytilinidion resinicola]|uniref:Uncharacterized protein n=1 Tax=Mytilinidion resinicola TaxID=574789 RepID=A0A6A6Z356_9PEZI|nr:uncharacterized protein BDZ99DRAFT_182662 [Mytilinidion resinicola]KAF2814677.1 hypothetical protein BDZ99DRAFT_182662 [Mytilinidion resinicola]